MNEQDLRQLIETLISTQAEHYVSAIVFFESYMDLFHSRPRLPWHHTTNDLKMLQNLASIRAELEKIPEEQWSQQRRQQMLDQLKHNFTSMVSETSDDYIDERNLGRWFYQYMRWALTGGHPGATLSVTMACLGRQNTLARLKSSEIELKSLTKKEKE